MDSDKLLTVQEFNNLVTKWAMRVRARSRATLSSGTHGTGQLATTLGQFVDKKSPTDAAYKVKFQFSRYGAFRAYGAGRGWVVINGTLTKADFVPEQETDFIFCTVGEEWGFIGCVTLLVLYTLLLQRLIVMAERQRSTFARVYGYSVASILFIHLFVNVGMVLGLVPVIGIPLPFFSYGGSSLLAFTVLLFIFIRQDASKNQLL